MNQTTESMLGGGPKARAKSHRTRGMGQIYRRGLVYWVQYYVHGKRYRESSNSTNRADAVRLLNRKMARAGKAGWPRGRKD